MAYEHSLSKRSYKAGADLSAKQFYFVVKNTSREVVAVSSAGATADGVVQNNPASGEMATVAVSGTTMVVCGGNITIGAQVASDASGKAIAATTGHRVLGRAEETGANGRIIAIELKLQGEPNA